MTTDRAILDELLRRARRQINRDDNLFATAIADVASFDLRIATLSAAFHDLSLRPQNAISTTHANNGSNPIAANNVGRKPGCVLKAAPTAGCTKN